MEAAGNDQKKLWKALADREDITEISAQSLADMLKAHISSPQSPMESAHPAPETTTGPSFEIQQLSVEAVKIALQNIDTNKATGIDLIPPRALQHAASVVAIPLSNIINTSIQLQCFPRLWGRAHVLPVYKNKGSKSDTAMYRPISILCAAVLVCERLVGSQLRYFLEDNRHFDDRQHGFRSRRDTCLAVMQTVDEAVKWLGRGSGRLAAILALDCSKAFDTVSHESILRALTAKGVSETSVEWFKMYLSDRECVVQIGVDTATGFTPNMGAASLAQYPSCYLLTYGTSRGDLRYWYVYQQYTDDITFVVQGSSVEDLVSRTKTAYERVSSSLRGLGISINGGMSQWMMVWTRQRLPKVPRDLSVTLDGVMILRKSTVTVLGVTIDEALSFTTRMESVCSKAAGRLRLLFLTTRRLPTRYRASLAKVLIYSPLSYCDTAMCNINAG